MTRFHLESDKGTVLVDGGPLLFYHFHGLRIIRRNTLLWPLHVATGARRLRIGQVDAAWASDFPLTLFETEAIWRPYVESVAQQTERVARIVPSLPELVPPIGPAAIARRAALRAPSPLPALWSRALRSIPRRKAPAHVDGDSEVASVSGLNGRATTHA